MRAFNVRQERFCGVAEGSPSSAEISRPRVVYVIGGGCFKDGTLPPDARMRVSAAIQLLLESRRAGQVCRIVLLGGTFRSGFNDAVQEMALLKRAYWNRYSLNENEVRLIQEGHSTAHQVNLIRQDLAGHDSDALVVANHWQLGYTRELCLARKLNARYEAVEETLVRRRPAYSRIVKAFEAMPCVRASRRRAGVQSSIVKYLGSLGFVLLIFLWKTMGTYMPPRPKNLFCALPRSSSAEFSR